MSDEKIVRETNPNNGLVARISQSPCRYASQFIITLQFINETLNVGLESIKKIERYAPQIKQVAGDVGVYSSLIGLPLLSMATIAALGYVAVKGTGMYFDTHLENGNSVHSVNLESK